MLSNSPETLLKFPDGFPTAGGAARSELITERVAAMRAYGRGIQQVDVSDASLSVEQAFRCDGLLPIVTDYLTHVLSPAMEWRFKSGREEKLVQQYLSSMTSDQPWTLSDLAESVRDQVNRPALYNKKDPRALMDAHTCVRTDSGIPLSVTWLMLDMAIEDIHQMSQEFQIRLSGESAPDTLDLTPTIEMLTNLEVSPRALLPEKVRERAKLLNTPESEKAGPEPSQE
ncbi:hypothetical protein EZI54_07190 [Marinobacter halodurans]|uniref:Uncharacterized protein n=1 Tax=Marinobacter halodurans TaxID=2528979 RepID=A0ABY1ZMP2_9GAMM|nr:hypothetical protein [Marinobacter halodurans]TBW57436.1 hypothetical protein EZI54_07190 [Marinobacter halodurans]